MPSLKIQTNVELPAGKRKPVLRAASALVAEMLGKPEAYVMVILEHNPDMLFAEDLGPLAALELKSIGLPGERTRELSASLCGFVEEQLGVPRNRIYIEFSDAARNMWGWNGGTFER